MTQAPGWTFSKIKEFDTCPRKYEGTYVTKEVPYTETEATIYGTELHKAAEDYIGEGTPLNSKFAWLQATLDRLNAIPGDKYCELELAIKRVDGQLVACGFKDKDYWMRGIADLAIVNGPVGHVVDYKSGKSSRYSDTRQLALMAAGMFLRFPTLETVKGALLFVVAGQIVKASYTRENALSIFAELNGLLAMRERAYELGVFNPKPNGLCRKYCGVTRCEHNGGG